MEFQRFEEETQQQTYQQPVGFNPANSVSQGGAIRQQYQQTQASKQFYNQSIDSRAAIRQANTEQAAANFANNNSNFVIDKLSEFIPTLNKVYQEGVARDRKAREQEGYVEEFQRVYDQGLSDAERQEEAAGKAQENLSNNAYNTAATDAIAATGNVEIARITRMDDPYKRMGAARAYASRVAQNDPTQLQEYLRNKAKENGGPLSSIQIQREVAAYNGANWVKSGLTQFKPSFLGEKYWSTFRNNQQKVISAAVKENQFQQGELDIQNAGMSLLERLDQNSLNDYITTIATSPNARGGLRSFKEGWESLPDILGNNKSPDEIRSFYESTTDPVTGKSNSVARAKSMNRAIQISQGLIDGERKREKALRQDGADASMAAALQRAGDLEGPELASALLADEQLKADRLKYFGASFSDVDNLINKSINPAANRARMAQYNDMASFTDAQILSDPNLTVKQQQALLNDPRASGYQERQEVKQAQKDSEATLKQTIKSVSDNYVTEAPDGSLNINGTAGRKMMQILETDLEFKLAEVKRDQEFADRSASDQYIEATRRTLEYAKTQYGLGKTAEEAKTAGVPNPIFATDASKGLNEDALSEDTFNQAVQKMDFQNPSTYLDVPGRGTSYRNNLERRSQDWVDGTLPPNLMSPMERAAVSKFGVPYADLVNQARLQAGLPVIPYSRWEAGVKNLPKQYQKLILNPLAGQTAQQRAEGMIQPPAPPAEVRTETAQGGASLPTQQKDAKGNWFNVDAVARQYSQSPQQRANVRRMLPSIDAASASTGVPSALIASLIGTESSFMPRSGPNTAYGNAVGPMQIIPMWHPNMPADEAGQIQYGAQYLKSLMNMTQGVHPSAPPVGTYKRALFLYSGDHNRRYSASDREYVEKTINRAWSFGMSELLSSTDMLRDSFANMVA